MYEFFVNLASSAYFALGAVSIIVVVLVLIITPIMNHIKQLDEVVMKKLSTLPTTETYATIMGVITDQNINNESMLVEYQLIKESVEKLIEVVNGLDDFQDTCDVKMGKFMAQMNELENRLTEYGNHIEFNENRSSIQINSLVKARIETTTFLIKLIDSLKGSSIIDSDLKSTSLYKIREDLRVGYESIKNANYTSSDSNPRSGAINKLTDFRY